MKPIVLIACLLSSALHGKDSLVTCRFLCFETAKDATAELLAAGKDGKPEKIPLTLDTLSKPVVLKAENGEISFQKEGPAAAPVATARIPATINDAIILFLPTTKDGLVHETFVLDSSAKAFPKGSSVVLNICRQKAKITIGEEEFEIKPNAFIRRSRPAKLDQFNMANVKALLEIDQAWRTAFESPVRFLVDQRNLFVTYIDPASQRPRFWSFSE